MSPDRKESLLDWVSTTLNNPLSVALTETLACCLVNLKNHEIIEASPEMPRMFGYDRHELEGVSVSNLVPNDVRGRHEQFMDTYAANPTIRYMGDRRLPGVKKDGSVFSLSIWLLPHEEDDGRIDNVLCLFFT